MQKYCSCNKVHRWFDKWLASASKKQTFHREIDSHKSTNVETAAWKSINEFCGRKSTPLSCIKASFIDEVKEKLRQHYANVLNRSPLLRPSMMTIMSPQSHLIRTLRKSPVSPRLASFEQPCQHPNYFLLLALTHSGYRSTD